MHTPETGDSSISAPVLEMLTVANEYCLFFESAEKYSSQDILGYFQKIAPLLYLKGSVMPSAEPPDDIIAERFVTEEEWEQIFKMLRARFGDTDIFYVHDHNNDSVEASLSETIADVYQDMKDFVMLYGQNTLAARQHAIAMLKGLFATRWGPGLINSLGAVHQRLFSEDIDPDLFAGENQWLI